MTPWALKYLGKAWDPVEGFGPNRFHCWGLVWYVYQAELGVSLPKYAGVSAKDFLEVQRRFTQGVAEAVAHQNGWQPVPPGESPPDFSVVAMSQGGRVIHHVGIYTPVDGGRVVHADDPVGVVAEPVSNLKRKWNRVIFFTYHGPRN